MHETNKNIKYKGERQKKKKKKKEIEKNEGEEKQKMGKKCFSCKVFIKPWVIPIDYNNLLRYLYFVCE